MQMLELIKTLTTWPVVTLASIIFVSHKFGSTIESWINRLTLKATFKDIAVVAEAQLIEVQKEKDQAKPPIEQVQPKSVSVPDRAQDAEAWRASAYIWEYRYLNYFLVSNTQRALDLLYSVPNGLPLATASSIVSQWAPDQNELQAILSALKMHHLSQVAGETIALTPKGREYVEFRGVPKPATR